ncbi:MAG: hypothetical protein AAFN93_07865 [Bacteroidota bacterium]
MKNLTYFLLCLILSSCNNGKSTSRELDLNSRANVIKCQTELSELSRYISVPDGVLNASWQINRLGSGELGPSDLSIVGLLAIEPQLSEQLVLPQNLSYRVGLQDSLLQECFSLEVERHFTESETTKGLMICREESYLPTLFVSHSLKRGFYFFIDESNIFIYMTSS